MRLLIALSAGALLGLGACSATHGDRINPSGPYPDAKTGNVVREKTDYGTLSMATPGSAVDTGYGIYTPEGRLVAEVPNHSELVVTPAGPTEIALPAGRYLVRLDRDDVDIRTFWVTIEAGKHTEVDPTKLGGGAGPNVR